MMGTSRCLLVVLALALGATEAAAQFRSNEAPRPEPRLPGYDRPESNPRYPGGGGGFRAGLEIGVPVFPVRPRRPVIEDEEEEVVEERAPRRPRRTVVIDEEMVNEPARPRRRPERKADPAKPPVAAKPAVAAKPLVTAKPPVTSKSAVAAKPETRPAARPAAEPSPRKVVRETPRPASRPAAEPPKRQAAPPTVAARDPDVVPGEVLIEVRGTLPPGEVDDLARQYRLTRVASERFDLLGSTVFRWRIPDGRSVLAVVRALQADGRIASAQPNRTFRLQQDVAAQNGTRTATRPQYALDILRLGEAHRLSRGEKVLIAVIDSGVDAKHPELEGVVVDAFDAIGGAFEPHSHGTAMAGAIAARADLTGAAPGAQLLAVRAFAPAATGGGQGTTFHILRALEYAHARGARVVNMSFAGPRDAILSRMLGAAREKGIVLVAAAGNAGTKSPPLHPAADPSVIAVTATDLANRIFSGANRGAHISLAAPGVDILVPAPQGAYEFTTGTSVAAAHVSGLVALILEREPGIGPDRVHKILTGSARDLGADGPDPDFGAGLADAMEAIASTQPRAEAVGAAAPTR